MLFPNFANMPWKKVVSSAVFFTSQECWWMGIFMWDSVHLWSTNNATFITIAITTCSTVSWVQHTWYSTHVLRGITHTQAPLTLDMKQEYSWYAVHEPCQHLNKLQLSFSALNDEPIQAKERRAVVTRQPICCNTARQGCHIATW